MRLFSRENLTLGLAVFAAILALAPYMVPQVQVFLVHQGLVKHPEQLLQATIALDKQQQMAERKDFEKSVLANQSALISPEDPVIGDPKAPITIVEFHDFLCGKCRMIAAHVEALPLKYKDVKVVFKELSIIGGQPSEVIAGMALASNKTGNYAKFHHALYQGTIESQGDIEKAIKGAGLNQKDLLSASQAPDIQAHLTQNYILAQRLGIRGTPTFSVNGSGVIGADIDSLEKEITAARARLKS